jgi:hypothetical protein
MNRHRRYKLRLLKQFLKGYLLGLALVAVVFLITSYAHCSLGKKHGNSIGSPMYVDNPMTYIAGSVVSVAYVEGGIVVRVQPIGTYRLYTEDKLFCGNGTVDQFRGVANPVVITYRIKASRLIEGLGCHQLVGVDGIKTKEVLQ